MSEYDIEAYLKQFYKERIDFFRFKGNCGDSLIWHGSLHLLRNHRITFHNRQPDNAPENEILFIDGGGNFIDLYDDVRSFVRENIDQYRSITLLPHTIMGNKQAALLQSLPSKVTIFCRERVSYEFTKKFANYAKVFLWHDCAFYCDLGRSAPSGRGTLLAFRTDAESTRIKLPANNFDLSKNGYATKPLSDFLSVLRTFNRVDTNRLHIAIAAARLGKEVILYPNSYYKNKAVYEYSLYNYPNVKFIDLG